MGGGAEATPRVRLGVFAKHWTPGRAKTRLAATVGDRRAAEAARRFLRATIDRLQAVPCERTIAYTPADSREAFAGLVDGLPWEAVPQPEGSLGDRMRWFFEASFERGAEAVLIVGADSPDLPLAAVRRAIAWLSQAEGPAERAVLAPTDDGGYWLVGARGAAPPIFDAVPWGTASVWDLTLRRLEEHDRRRGQDYEVLDRWYDVDTGEDLAALRQRLADAADEPLARLERELSALFAG